MNFRRFRVLVSLLAIVIAFSACYFLKYPRDGIYLIPAGYTGSVIIVFGQPDGVTLETENGLFLYRIPPDGLLRVKDKGYTGIVNTSYYYVTQSGNRTKIDLLLVTGDHSPHGLPQNKFGNISQGDFENRVYVMGSGGLGALTPGTDPIQFTSFVVATPKQAEADNERIYDLMQQRITAIQRSLMGKK